LKIDSGKEKKQEVQKSNRNERNANDLQQSRAKSLRNTENRKATGDNESEAAGKSMISARSSSKFSLECLKNLNLVRKRNE